MMILTKRCIAFKARKIMQVFGLVFSVGPPLELFSTDALGLRGSLQFTICPILILFLIFLKKSFKN